jgi:hypothetical protein
MRRAAALLALVGFVACSFPDFEVAPAREATCDDKKRNGDETGLDCGMEACGTSCPLGQGCDTDRDCEDGHCAAGVCSPPSCDDGHENGDESDIDCGGEDACARCAVGQRCRATSDCDGGQCVTAVCRSPTCTDELINGTETDMDCGGTECPPCKPGQKCEAVEDCDDTACTDAVCQARNCSDGVFNQDETDRDCGGSCANQCDDGEGCKVADDCQSGVCAAGALVCAEPSCSDEVRNGDEPSVDCGGTQCSKKCALLDGCRVPEDCASGACSGDHCVPKSPTGDLLTTGSWVASASSKTANTQYSSAIDGLQSTYWISGTDQVTQPLMWFEIDMGAEQAFFSIELDNNDEQDTAEAIDVHLSSNHSYDAPPVVRNRSLAPKDALTFDTAQVARYIRFSITQGKARWWRIDEIRVRQ